MACKVMSSSGSKSIKNRQQIAEVNNDMSSSYPSISVFHRTPYKPYTFPVIYDLTACVQNVGLNMGEKRSAIWPLKSCRFRRQP